ncbi:hypothetical protein BDZ97DRAFT_1841060 [Flammula alnicola]|nr:hypothetical protein BDZ97DRAFT_1841060 [Flammula alnicola]
MLPLRFLCVTKSATGVVCNRGFHNRSGLTQHIHSQHRKFAPEIPAPAPIPPYENFDHEGQHEANEPVLPIQQPEIIKHPILDGTPCNKDGVDLPPGTPPIKIPAKPSDYAPYQNRADFELANFLFNKNQMPGSQIDELLNIWAARSTSDPPFADHKDLYRTIDATVLGDAPWSSFSVTYSGPQPAEGEEIPPWMVSEYEVWHRDPRVVMQQQLSNPDFNDGIHYAPFQETDASGERKWQDLMSGNWAWKQADTIAEDPETHGAMFVPGQTEYYPLYASLGNVHNSVRRAHRNAVTIIGFLAIPKTDREYADDDQFRKFRRQLFHSSLAAILEPLKPGMSKPEVVLCPDGHYRRAIYGLGPYIADYPEQCLLGCIVQDWCPRCTAFPHDLDGKAGLRSNAHRDALIDALSLKSAWADYGYVGDVIPFTADFPRADIHELLTSDLLHQVIKGTFKDHLVTWVGEYLVIKHGKTGAAAIMADIDRRIAAVPSFPGLRRFPEGRGFKQWTGDDSKALMKVYLPAIVGHVPAQMVQALAAFLDFCYLVRRWVHTEATLCEIDDALVRFHKHRKIFEDEGIRPDGLSLPRQHSLVHYKTVIQLFGSPNGLCSSITESKHIKAVKEPWRRSSHYKALGQMLLTNQRLDKLAASKVDFIARGMLSGPLPVAGVVLEAVDDDDGDDDDSVAGPRVMAEVFLARTPARGYPTQPSSLAQYLNLPESPTFLHLIQTFLFDQLHPNAPNPSFEQPLNVLPTFNGRIKVFHSAVAEFFAPSDPAGVGGMHRERIRATTMWRGEGPRHDCLFATKDPDLKGMRGLHAARAILFFSFKFNHILYPCSLVQWFSAVGEEPCPETGMWMVERDWEEDGTQSMGVIHVDSIVRGAHLIPVYGDEFLPPYISYSNSLDHYAAYYVSKYADHHANEVAF